MPKQPKEKSAHLQELEAVFDRHTRRFSPFDVLGLRSSSEVDTADPKLEETNVNVPPTHVGVDAIHSHVPPTHTGEGGTPLPGEGIHTRVVEVKENTSTNDPDLYNVPPTH